jgi:hypothetical protein
MGCKFVQSQGMGGTTPGDAGPGGVKVLGRNDLPSKTQAKAVETVSQPFQAATIAQTSLTKIRCG